LIIVKGLVAVCILANSKIKFLKKLKNKEQGGSSTIGKGTGDCMIVVAHFHHVRLPYKLYGSEIL